MDEERKNLHAYEGLDKQGKARLQKEIDELKAPYNAEPSNTEDKRTTEDNNFNSSLHNVVCGYVSSIDKALSDCLEPQMGMGITEYTINANTLYNQVKATNEMLKLFIKK